MSPSDLVRAEELISRLADFNEVPLVGLNSDATTEALAMQMVDSERRIAFAHHLRDAQHDPRRADPHHVLFDPLRAAVLHLRAGDHNNAAWLVFLATHFGKHQIDGWRLLRDVYGRMGQEPIWAWNELFHDFPSFVAWYEAVLPVLQKDGISRRFSNHRKYESLKHVPDVFHSFITWVGEAGGQVEQIRVTHREVGQHPGDVFDALYRGMKAVHRFGRLAKFDYLAMLGKLGIAPVEPTSPYLFGATGPLAGARLLLTGDRKGGVSVSDANNLLVALGDHLQVGMQAMEDSLCNWQKSPQAYVRFRG